MNHILPGLIELVIKVGPYAALFAVACAAVVVLLSVLQYQGASLTKNEPFRWALKHPRFRTNPLDRAFLNGKTDG